MKRMRWTALLGCLLLAIGAWAADTAEQDIRTTILKSVEGWSTLNPDVNDAYYTSSDSAVFFDIAPMQYAGWQSYKEGAKKMFAGFKDLKLALNDDLAVHRAGKFAWATATWKGDAHLKDGKELHLEGRATLVLEKQKGKWIIFHEHYSVPAPM